MPTISVAMIVKNEAADLAQCLDTVKDWVDEIIIVDSGSTDNTQEIAEQYGAKFYSHLIGQVLANNANVHNNMSPVIMFCG